MFQRECNKHGIGLYSGVNLPADIIGQPSRLRSSAGMRAHERFPMPEQTDRRDHDLRLNKAAVGPCFRDATFEFKFPSP